VVDLTFGWIGPRLRPFDVRRESAIAKNEKQNNQDSGDQFANYEWIYGPAIGSIRVRHNDSSYRPNVQSGLERGLGGEA
jgi:hypothetical protein